MSARTVLWRGMFNAWQRGIAGHINIQHYAQAIDEARRALVIGQGHDPHAMRAAGQGIGARFHRIDFRAELSPGDAVRLEAGPVRADDGTTLMAGEMIRVRDGAVVDRFECSLDAIDGATATFAAPLRFDGPPAARLRPMAPPVVPDAPHPAMQRTWLGPVEVREVDELGLLGPRGLFDMTTRGIWAAQIRLGLTLDTFRKEGFAGGVSALMLRQVRLARLAELLEVRTCVTGIGTRSIRFGHWIGNADSGATVATVDYVMAFADRATGAPRPPSQRILDAARAALMDMDAA